MDPEKAPLTSSKSADVLIATQAGLDQLIRHLRVMPRFAIDTEADSYYAYSIRSCLFHFSTADGDFLVDPLQPLDFSAFGALFASPEIEKVFHAGENDIGLLRARFGFSFRRVFDTMVAA